MIWGSHAYPGGLVEGAYVASGPGGIDERRRSTTPPLAPAGTTGFRLVVAAPSGGVLPVWGIKVNFGAVATDFSDDYSATVLEASVTQQSLAIVDLENQQAIASWRIKSEASGSKPAIIEAVSALGGSFIALSAEQIYFGANTVFDDPTDTWQRLRPWRRGRRSVRSVSCRPCSRVGRGSALHVQKRKARRT